MITRTMLRICLLLFLSVLCLDPAWIAFAEDCQECDGKGTPTPAGNAEYSPGWECECSDIIPTIYDNDADDLIPSAGSVNLWVNSGGLACPPYTWTVSGTGWSLNKNVTENDLEIVTLSLINTTGKTCGTHYSVYCTVTVTDNCGKTDDIIFRYSGGKWGSLVTVVSGCYHISNGYVTADIGNKRWKINHWSGTTIGPSASCSTCLQGNACKVWMANNYELFRAIVFKHTGKYPICCIGLVTNCEIYYKNTCNDPSSIIIPVSITYQPWVCP